MKTNLNRVVFLVIGLILGFLLAKETTKPITASGPDGQKIVLKDGHWVDAKTGGPPQQIPISAYGPHGERIVLKDGKWVDAKTGGPPQPISN